MNAYLPFAPGSADYTRASVREANERLGNAPEVPFDPLSVRPVTASVRQMDEARLAILLRPGAPLTADEWAQIEGNL